MPQYRGTVQAGTWVRDEQAVVMADAMWSLARYAVFGGPKPSAKELELVNGPKLAKLSELDLKVPIEQAAKRVMAEFPWASCQTINDLNKKETQMVCKIEVDHPLIKEVHLAWPNGAAASIEAAAFAFTEPEPKGSAAPGAIQGCLDKALGAGQDVVTDHATGKSQHSWQLDRAGDKATIESYGLSLDAPDGRDLTVTPAWVGRFAAVVTALDACRP
jgi:hypothetical protein